MRAFIVYWLNTDNPDGVIMVTDDNDATTEEEMIREWHKENNPTFEIESYFCAEANKVTVIDNLYQHDQNP